MRFIANFCLVLRDTWSRYTHTHAFTHALPAELLFSRRNAIVTHFQGQLTRLNCNCCCCYSDNSNSCCYGHTSVKVVWPKDVGISLTTIRLQQMWIIAAVHFLFPNRRPMRSMVFRICRIYSLCASWSVNRNNFRGRHKTAKATTKCCDYDIYKIIRFVLHKWQNDKNNMHSELTLKLAPVKVRLSVSAGEDYSDSNNNNNNSNTDNNNWDNNKNNEWSRLQQRIVDCKIPISRKGKCRKGNLTITSKIKGYKDKNN